MTSRAGTVLALLLTGCLERPEKMPFEDACRALVKVPIGTDIREIERRLSLPPPRKTLSGSMLYHNRIFEYVRGDGLFVSIGLQEEPDGRFLAVGHYGVALGRRSWMQWEWDN